MKGKTIKQGSTGWYAPSVLACGSEMDFVKKYDKIAYQELDEKERKQSLKVVYRAAKKLIPQEEKKEDDIRDADSS